MMKKISPFTPSLFFDFDIGADMTDLDNSTYFETVKELNSHQDLGFW